MTYQKHTGSDRFGARANEKEADSEGRGVMNRRHVVVALGAGAAASQLIHGRSYAADPVTSVNPWPHGPKVLGGAWTGTSAAVGGFRMLDVQGCEIAHMKIEGFTNGASLAPGSETGFAVEFRNQSIWSELNWVHDVRIEADRLGILFSPSGVTGGSGTASFARTRLQRVDLHQGSPLLPMCWLRGGVYDSTIADLGGNLRVANTYVLRIDHGRHRMNWAAVRRPAGAVRRTSRWSVRCKRTGAIERRPMSRDAVSCRAPAQRGHLC